MKYRWLLCVFIPLLLFMACGIGDPINSMTSSQTQRTHISTIPTIEPIETITIRQTNTPVAPLTPTPRRQPTLTLTQATLIPNIPVCLGGNTPVKVDDSFGFQGTMVIDGESKGIVTILGGIPVISSILSLSETQDIALFGFSPDGKWLAYSPYTKNQIEPRQEFITVVLLSADGTRIEHALDIIHAFPEFGKGMYPNALPVYWFGQWINDNLLYLQIYYLDAPGITKTMRLHAIIDPFEGTWRNDLFSNLPSRYERHFFSISPDMRRTVYMRKNPTGIVFWDNEQQRIIWSELTFSHAQEIGIFWSPDSVKAAYFKYPFDDDDDDSHIFLINQENVENKTIIDSNDISLKINPALDAQWSSDDRYLAIIGSRYQPDNYQTVFVYDTMENKFAYLCSIKGFFDGLPRLQWSPDGKYLASFSSGSTENDTPIYIIDFDSGAVYELIQKGQVYGWSDVNFLLNP